MSSDERLHWDTEDGAPPPEIRRALRQADMEDGSADQIARLAARLGAIVGPVSLPSAPAPTAPTTPPVPPSAAGLAGSQAAIVKIIAGTSVAVAVAGAGVALTRGGEDSGAAKPAATNTASFSQSATAGEPRTREEAPSPAVPTEHPPSGEPRAAVTPTSSVVRSSRPSVAPSAEALSDEAHIVGDARVALAGDPGRALALANLHRQRHPSGTLAHEREVLAISALLRLGRRADARARLDAFEKAFPWSTHAARFEQDLELR